MVGLKETPRRGDDRGVSSVLGATLILGLMASMIPGLMLLKASMVDVMEAQTQENAQIAYCIRHPSAGADEGCDGREARPGYECERVPGAPDTWVCYGPGERRASEPKAAVEVLGVES